MPVMAIGVHWFGTAGMVKVSSSCNSASVRHISSLRTRSASYSKSRFRRFSHNEEVLLVFQPDHGHRQESLARVTAHEREAD